MFQIFKSHLRVIGTEKWNRVMTVSVGYPGFGTRHSLVPYMTINDVLFKDIEPIISLDFIHCSSSFINAQDNLRQSDWMKVGHVECRGRAVQLTGLKFWC